MANKVIYAVYEDPELLKDAARTCDRIWILADYEAPPGVSLAAVFDLG